MTDTAASIALGSGIALADVVAARERLSSHLERTPVVASAPIDAAAARRVWLKCENLQRTGSFKVRGALNALLQMPTKHARRGVVTASSGNFGLGLAWAAEVLGIRASVVMPRDAGRMKRRATEEAGASVHLCDPVLSDRARVTAEVVRETGARYVSPHDDPDVIAGQGTVALEILEQMPRVEAVVVPVGGGGLIAGIAVAARAQRPDIRIVGAQPAGAADAARSKAAGKLLTEDAPRSLASGLLVNLGEKTWPIVRTLVDDIVTVDESEIVAAMRLTWEQAKLIVEPSAAVSVAALTSRELRPRIRGGTAVAVLSGGNVDLDDLPW